MKTSFRLGLPFFFLITLQYSHGQTYQGPAVGSVASGSSVTTGSFLKSVEIGPPREKGTRNVGGIENTPRFIDFGNRSNVYQSIYSEDRGYLGKNTQGNSNTILLKNFKGLSMGNSIPPDPHVAAGPTHIIATVNTSFGIWDKEGNLIQTINPDTWFQGLVSDPGCFDPQIMYDHYEKKWIMTWDSQDDALKRAHFLVAVSDDSIPLGNWYIWALPANQNGGTVVNNWGDYPHIGFDKEAIYINSRSWTFATTTTPAQYQYNKIRIIAKSDIYNNLGGAISWTDIWDITDTDVSVTYKPDVIMPAITYDSDDPNYFLHSPRYGGNFVSLYSITNPTSNPVLTRVNILVEPFNAAPNANQKGGSSTLISSNESGMTTSPIYRNGYLWGVQSIENPTSAGYSSVRYYKIDVGNSTVVETATLGNSGYWYLFPALTIDKDENLAITYSRSGNDEYCGAYFTTRLKNDPPGLSGSNVLQEGKGNYVVTFGGTRNRWGDYMGIFLDPFDENNVWLFTEYADVNNKWGTWVGKIRMIPFPTATLFTEIPSLEFGDLEINAVSDTLFSKIKNIGAETLVITSIPNSIGPFRMVSNLSFPLNLASYDSAVIKFVFSPVDTGNYNTNYSIACNDPLFTGFTLTGYAYVINPAVQNQLYSTSGSGNGGKIGTIDISSGIASNIGPSLFPEIRSISINPKNKVIYGVIPSGSVPSKLLRINSQKGDAYLLYEFPSVFLTSLAFDTTGVLFAAARNGKIYQINLDNGQIDSIMTAPISISSIAFNPIDNELWTSIYTTSTGKDRIYKLDKLTGDTIRIGQTGFNIVTNGIAFDENGNLFGVTGLASQINNLISINTSTGVGTLIGATGLKHLTDIAYLAIKPTSIKSNQSTVPSQYSLKQNYPNPFNPSTTIEFALPVSAKVKVKVYNLLGQTVKVIYDGGKDVGYHKLNWNSDDVNGNSVSSGIYFYELSAAGIDGSEFTQMKKMILIK